MPKISVLLFVILFLELPTLQAEEENTSPYRIYIDAGSSGTRLGIYRIQSTQDADLTIEEIGERGTRSGIGIHQFVDREKDTASYLNPLLNYAESTIGKKELAKTPIFFYATGGLRSFPKNKQKILLQHIEHYLKEKKFEFVSAKVLSGAEEALYGWLMVNHLMHHFSLKQKDARTVGVLDFGGASLQIAFEVNPSQIQRPYAQHILDLKIGNKIYHTYSYSYPLTGQNSLLNDNLHLQKACLQKFYTQKKLKTRYTQCFQNLHKQFIKTCKDKTHCGLVDVYQPPISGHFIGIGGIAYMSRQLNYEQFNFDYVKTKGFELCSLTDKEIHLKYPLNYIDSKDSMCFRIAYYRALLYGDEHSNGLGFSKQEAIEVPSNINGYRSFSWMLGAVFYRERVTLL